jgi:hypothetical protein
VKHLDPAIEAVDGKVDKRALVHRLRDAVKRLRIGGK